MTGLTVTAGRQLATSQTPSETPCGGLPLPWSRMLDFMTGSECRPPQRPFIRRDKGVRAPTTYSDIYQFAQVQQHPTYRQLVSKVFSSFYLWLIVFFLVAGLMMKHGIWPLD